MSTHDAYNLSVRDSTEFTVPTGGSGGDSQFDLIDVTINVNGSADGLFEVIRYGTFLVEDNMLEDYYNTNKMIASLPALQPSSIINAHVVIPHNGVATIQLAGNVVYSISNVSVTGSLEIFNEDTNAAVIGVRGPGTLTFTITPVGEAADDPSNPTNPK